MCGEFAEPVGVHAIGLQVNNKLQQVCRRQPQLGAVLN